MPSAYVDRGIIKWNAFDALVGYSSMLEEMKYRLGKKAKPILSDDAYEELNRKLGIALQESKDVEISYYHNGYIRHTFGQIKKVDYQNKRIILSTFEKLDADDIIDICL
ncbi:MAG: YolD-like family protein [Candidatus Izemoplasmatales bacterium]|nr:YolD-like family protein [Candidatus Izemoplasmatales bacterium]